MTIALFVLVLLLVLAEAHRALRRHITGRRLRAQFRTGAVTAAHVLEDSKARQVELLEQLAHERLVVTLKDGTTCTGLLRGVDERTVELVGAHMLEGAGTADAHQVPVDGELLLPRAAIAYMQRVST